MSLNYNLNYSKAPNLDFFLGNFFYLFKDIENEIEFPEFWYFHKYLVNKKNIFNNSLINQMPDILSNYYFKVKIHEKKNNSIL